MNHDGNRPDPDSYPMEAALVRIEQWPIETTQDFRDVMAFARSLWTYPERWRVNGRRHTISTGGWWGNESIVAAMEANQMLQMVCAESWHRGGHYVYVVPRLREPNSGYHASAPVPHHNCVFR